MLFQLPQQELQFSRKMIQAGTGKEYTEWANILDSKRSMHKGLTPVIECLKNEYGLSQAWARTIASYYVLQ